MWLLFILLNFEMETGSGTPFHDHELALNLAFAGRKRWLIAAHDTELLPAGPHEILHSLLPSPQFQVRERGLRSTVYKNDHFIKTGSEQTQQNPLRFLAGGVGEAGGCGTGMGLHAVGGRGCIPTEQILARHCQLGGGRGCGGAV